MEAIESVIKQTEAAFNGSDAEALAATFTADAWTVGVTGQVLQGRDEFLETSRTLFAGPLAGQSARYVVVAVPNGGALCRERGCQFGEVSAVPVAVKTPDTKIPSSCSLTTR